MALSAGLSSFAEGAISGDRKGMVSSAERLLKPISTLPDLCTWERGWRAHDLVT